MSAASSSSVGGAVKASPSDYLRTILGRPVVIKLNSGVLYSGVLACLDGYMNVALEQCQEIHDGKVKRAHGDTFIRGNNIRYISINNTQQT